MDHWFAIQFHIYLDVTNSGSLIIDIALDLIMPCIELKEVNRRSFFSLSFEEFGHKFDFLELAGQLNFVTFQNC